MATYTTNLDLKKPAQNDKIRIADINNNMDTLDGAVGDIGERSIAAQIGDVEGALAIVSTGNVHGAITAGQYVYIKNHDTLDDGLYVASSNIAANATLSSSNVTADSAGGGLNALNGKIQTVANSTSIGSFGTQSALDSALDTLLASVQNDGIYSFQFTTTAAFGVFQGSVNYVGTIYKVGSNTTFSHATFKIISDVNVIQARRNSSGWFYESHFGHVQKDSIVGNSSRTFTLPSKICLVSVARAATSGTGTTAIIDQWGGIVYLSQYSAFTLSFNTDTNVLTVNNTSGGYVSIIVIY